jgi:hypothetical protein
MILGYLIQVVWFPFRKNVNADQGSLTHVAYPCSRLCSVPELRAGSRWKWVNLNICLYSRVSRYRPALHRVKRMRMSLQIQVSHQLFVKQLRVFGPANHLSPTVQTRSPAAGVIIIPANQKPDQRRTHHVVIQISTIVLSISAM